MTFTPTSKWLTSSQPTSLFVEISTEVCEIALLWIEKTTKLESLHLHNDPQPSPKMATQAKLSTLAYHCLLRPSASPFNFLEHRQSLSFRMQKLTLLSKLAKPSGVEGLALSGFIVKVDTLHLALAVGE